MVAGIVAGMAAGGAAKALANPTDNIAAHASARHVKDPVFPRGMAGNVPSALFCRQNEMRRNHLANSNDEVHSTASEPASMMQSNQEQLCGRSHSCPP
jgi:hypothetical protein